MPERRSAQRYKLALPIEIMHPTPSARSRRLRGQTRDISTSGIYFTLPEPLPPKSTFQFSVTLPPELTDGIEVQITAQGRVVRTERKPPSAEQLGIAATIDKYEIVSREVEGPGAGG
jgi:c-di-GMP-binding flagellar brake protein YcgR